MTQPTSGSNSTLADELNRRRGRQPVYSPEEKKDRAKKAARAQTLALGVLKVRHEEEYQELYKKAKAEVGLE